MPDPRPRLVLRKNRRHLRQSEDEDEVEEELERRDPVLVLDSLLAHRPRLALSPKTTLEAPSPEADRRSGNPLRGLRQMSCWPPSMS
jgi:hypothetical protein